MTESLDTQSLSLVWSNSPWDAAATGYPVWQIESIELRGPGAGEDMRLFDQARDHEGVGLVSCRLSHSRLDLSIFLEDHGFRFIEMLYQPELDLISGWGGSAPIAHLRVRLASQADLPATIDMAGSAFVNERFHMDPRLGATFGNLRYQNWVRSSLDHPTQRLYVLEDEQGPLSFFVTEMLEDGTCYWHLNAIDPRRQGQGLGRLAWLTMLQHAVEEGAIRVRTSIVARNHRVLNLYARLGFRFPPPLMTFHWVREGEA